LTNHIGKMEQEVLSRTSLEGLIVGLGLYKSQRREKPMEDIVQDMRNHEISIRPIHEVGGHRQDSVAFSISTTYPDPKLAQAMNRELVSKFTEQNVLVARAGDLPMGENLEVLDPASLPQNPIEPHKVQWVLAGLFAGLLAGLTVSYAMRWRIMIVRRPAQ
jgi:capsular polysaccharide biosynthesis protein